MKITDKLNELIDSLAEWLGIRPKPIPVRVRPRKDIK